jgi:ribosomal protein S12 methylthiotransferase accessory factor
MKEQQPVFRRLSLEISNSHPVEVATRIGPHLFESTPIVTGSGHSCEYEATLARVKPLISRVPITRLTNVTPIDFLGFPIWSAITPLARDLTVHAGKGADASSARLSAIMEAVERTCAEEYPQNQYFDASFAELQEAHCEFTVIDPTRFDLPFDTKYHPAVPITWAITYDLLQNCYAVVPADLVISPSRDQICSGPETNGLAAGNNYTEATMHALYEIVERDAFSQDRFFNLYSDPTDRFQRPIRMIDLSTVPPNAHFWIDRLLDAGLEVHVQDLTSELLVPVFGARLVDHAFPGVNADISVVGYGADLDASRALFRAITEAVQAHTIVTLGARDTFESFHRKGHRLGTLLRRLDTWKPMQETSFTDGDTASSGDLRRDLDSVLDRLVRVGLRHCLVADLARDDLQIPVVRVLVPGLAGPYGDTSRRPGIRLLRTIMS